MPTLLLLSAALAADSTDVVATRTVHAPAEAVHAYLVDLRHHEALWPAGCVKKWESGAPAAGKGAAATMTYSPSCLRRRLTGTLTRAAAGERIELDHAGRKGFITTWTLEERGDSTQVEMHTWIQPPPWPFRRTYTNRVQPAWQWCHDGFLVNLDGALGARPD